MPRVQIAKCPDGWAIFDEDASRIVYRGPAPETYFTEELRRWLLDPPPQMSYLEMRLRAREFPCSSCGEPVEVSDYNHRAPESRQLCRRCKNG